VFVLNYFTGKGGEIIIKKIFGSLLTLGFMALVAFAVTSAFFSDTETSVDNRLEAGKIDLKVDHVYASYNGRECDEDCVEQENLLTQIGFENPVVTSASLWDIYNSPVDGWTVEWRGDIPADFGGVDKPAVAKLEYHRGVLGSAYEGQQYVELDTDWNGHVGTLNNEPASVSIYQDLVTVPGTKYRIKFAFAPRPNTPAADNRLEVKWNGIVVHDTGVVAGGPAPIAWQVIEVDVTATGASSELRFTDLGTANSLGTFIDDINLYRLDCETQIGEEFCKLWEEKDLEPGDVFWDFGDVKPGDYGRNVISMHVYDNNYWACLLSEKTDLENVIIEPEADFGDVTDPEGELSKYVDIFIWMDLDFDGVYEPVGETALYENGFPDAIDLSEPPAANWLASTTYYLGLAWCIGDQTVHHDTGLIECDGTGNQNDAQTDTLTVDLKFYAEQSRNNPDFSCEALLTPTPSPGDE
jgi:predicted ribosomally synthesized peptide with SipW-like signal peptide